MDIRASSCRHQRFRAREAQQFEYVSMCETGADSVGHCESRLFEQGFESCRVYLQSQAYVNARTFTSLAYSTTVVVNLLRQQLLLPMVNASTALACAIACGNLQS